MGDPGSGAGWVEIIVQFVEGDDPQPITQDDKGRLTAKGIDFRPFYAVLAPVDECLVRPSFSLEPRRLLALRTRAQEHSGRKDIPWLNYFVRVSVAANTSVKKLVLELRALAIVASAGVAGRTCPAVVYEQGYLGPASDGVDADHAWPFGGDGQGIRVCVCDWAFADRHADLPPIVDLTAPTPGGAVVAPTTPQMASDLPPHANHGTAALGTLLALDDGVGTKGLCPKAEGYFASVLPSGGSGGTIPDVTNAIDVALEVLGPGDILLVECQVEETTHAVIQGVDEDSWPVNHPVDYNLDVRAAILTGVESGIAVVLPAGNGAGDRFGQDLSALTSGDELSIWNPTSDQKDDCGAILVGAGETPAVGVARTRRPASNYGRRVTCQGWGRGIATPGWADGYTGDVKDRYVGFTDTSGASAMVAGVVACLQSAAKLHHGAPLEPSEVRALLASPCLGSPQPEDDAAVTPIGPLPDLRRLLRAAGVTPDLYLRDGVNDDGTEPLPRARACGSPDIIVVEAVGGPSPSALATEAAWDAGYPGVARDPAEPHQILLRVRNRSPLAGRARVAVHTTPAAPYTHPSTWLHVETVAPAGVGANAIRVLGPVPWPASSRGGRRGLATVLSRPGDELPDLPSLTTPEYARLLHCRHDIALRQVHEFEAQPGTWTPWFVFQVRGDPYVPLTFDLTLRSSLPAGAIVETEPPMPAPDRRSPLGPPLGPPRPLDGLDTRHLELSLDADEVRGMRVRAFLPRRSRPGLHVIGLDQWHEGWHLGRLTYVLRVPPLDSPA